MNYVDYIGYIATFFSVLSFLPVIINIYKTKQANNFPYQTIILAYLSNGLFLLNGILSKNNVLIFLGIVFILIYSYILYVKLLFKKKK